MEAQGVRYIINIVKTEKGGRRVRPAKLTVEGGDWVEWKNTLDETVLLTLNRGDEIFERFPNSAAKGTIEIPPEQSRAFRVNDFPLHGDHSYQVFGASSKSYYSGDSDPRIDVL
jgi:hypothetical protein